MSDEKRPRTFLRTTRSIVVVLLLLGLAGLETFAIMSDNSVHGLTVRFSYISRSCNTTGTQSILTYLANPVIVYSGNSLPTGITHVTFAMSVGGVMIGTTTAGDASFGAGQSASYSLQFTNTTLDPHSEPLTSQVVLSISALVSAGLFSSQVTSSDSQPIQFPGRAC